MNPPEEEQTVQQYNEGVSSKLAYYRLAAAADKRSFDSLLRIIEQHKSRGSILDVGCNIGTFVRAAEQRGWQATGVDLNAEAIAAVIGDSEAATGWYFTFRIAQRPSQLTGLLLQDPARS